MTLNNSNSSLSLVLRKFPGHSTIFRHGAILLITGEMYRDAVNSISPGWSCLPYDVQHDLRGYTTTRTPTDRYKVHHHGSEGLPNNGVFPHVGNAGDQFVVSRSSLICRHFSNFQMDLQKQKLLMSFFLYSRLLVSI